LGAATASSSDEISQGLEKFAAVANTVGLSYEYATAALATVTATTRQSADVVGTAFKTLFARIQDLDLGKDLDDGVTLGKYSDALASIGVNVLDTNGGLKDMDIILDELGAKWSSLSKAQ
jgi:TP901 family phage tail tape measure protein